LIKDYQKAWKEGVGPDVINALTMPQIYWLNWSGNANDYSSNLKKARELKAKRQKEANGLV